MTLSILGPRHEIPTEVDTTLATVLSWPRPHGSPAELAFGKWLSAEITKITLQPCRRLATDCLFVQINGKKDVQPTVLFSCHIDTVDVDFSGQLVGNKVQRKSLTYDPNFGLIGLDKESVGSCLGADDGAGIWLMLEMLKAKVPGGYIFHRGEERGGIGSRAMLVENRALLEQFDLAVAFDRARDCEVIVKQGGQECASEKFGTALCKKLNEAGMDYTNSDKGSFTDTKVYRGVIAECVNLGVGYDGQHGVGETQDYAHLVAMAKALIAIDWESLPVDRDPKKPDPAVGKWSSSNMSTRGNMGFGGYDVGGYPQRSLDDYDTPSWGTYKDKNKGKKKKPPQAYMPSQFETLKNSSVLEIVDWCLDDPESAAQAMVHLMLEIGRYKSDVEVLKGLAGVTDAN